MNRTPLFQPEVSEPSDEWYGYDWESYEPPC